MPLLALNIDLLSLYEPEPIPVSSPASPAGMPALHRACATAIDEHGPSVLLVDPSTSPRMRELVDSVRMLLGASRLAIATTSLPPLAASVAAAVLAGVMERLDDPLDSALLVPEVERRMVSLAWLSRVTGLERITVPFGLHLRSYASRAGFVACAGPEPGVEAVGDLDQLSLPPLPESAHVVVADRQGRPDWCRSELLPALGDAPVTEVPPTANGPDWWGCPRLTEVVAFSADLDLFEESLNSMPLSRCGWCGAATTEACGRCGAARPADAAENRGW